MTDTCEGASAWRGHEGQWPTIPDRSLTQGLGMDASQVEDALKIATLWLKTADAIVIVSGAGMGVDSGLCTYQGGGGVSGWQGLEGLGVSFEHMCDPARFQQDPRLAWSFWAHLCRICACRQPHEGYRILRTLAAEAPLGAFVLTTALDGHWLTSGWPPERLVEIHGSTLQLQCVTPCRGDAWPLPDLCGLSEDPKTRRTFGELPSCPHCGGLARPAVHMFNDEASVAVKNAQEQRGRFDAWLTELDALNTKKSPDPEGLSLVILELGCGPRSALRRDIERLTAHFEVHFIRASPGESSAVADTQLTDRAVSLPLGALAALSRLEQLTRDDLPSANFLCIDGECSGGVVNGAEISAPVDACVGHVYRKTVAALAGAVTARKGQDIRFRTQHVHKEVLMMSLKGFDSVPHGFFFRRTNEAGEEPRVTRVLVSGISFGGRNGLLEARMARARSLADDLIAEFQAPRYQEELDKVSDPTAIKTLIRKVHLSVLPRHGFPTVGASPATVFELVMQMQGFLQSGFLTPEMFALGQRSLALSGYLKIIEAAQARKAHAKHGAAKLKPSTPSDAATCVVLLRHGQREDYSALEDGWGAEWIAMAHRPWDPRLSPEGRRQVQVVARRLRFELTSRGLALPSKIYTSPLVRCVETSDVVAGEFAIDTLFVEEGLAEVVCEAWMRQWAVPGADATWGGPAHAKMSHDATHRYSTDVQGPPVGPGRLHAEAGSKPRSWLSTAEELASRGDFKAKVDPKHQSLLSLRGARYSWGDFETKEHAVKRIMATIQARVEEHPAQTIVFVSHGGPTEWSFCGLVGERPPKGSGGMTALSILRQKRESDDGKSWEPLVSSDASHVLDLRTTYAFRA